MYKFVFTKKVKLEFELENFMPPPEEEVPETVPVQAEIENLIVIPDEAEEKIEVEAATQLGQEETEIKLVDNENPDVPSVNLQVYDQPSRSPKHEAAVQELKNYIQTILQSKLDEIKGSIAQKIAEQDSLVPKPVKNTDDEKKKPSTKGKK